MRAILVALILAGLTGAASAQGINLAPQDKRLTSEEIEKQKKIDEEYRAAIQKVPDQKKTNNDPWAIVRTPEPAKAPAKTAHPKSGAQAKMGAQPKAATGSRPPAAQ